MAKITNLQAAQILDSYKNRRVQFVRDVIGVEPDEWQAEALTALDNGHNVAIRSGHGVGKTSCMSWIVIHAVATHGFAKVPCTAPTGHQLRDLLWAEIAMWLNRSKLKDMLTWTATSLSVKGFEESWFAVARACSKPENLAGFHAPKLIYVVDEGSGVADNIFETIDGALTTANAQMVMAGNPTQRSGYFYDAFHKHGSAWHKIHVNSENSPRVTKAYCEGMAKKWGRDTDIYRVRVLGDFPEAESDAFISLSLVEAAILRYELNKEKELDGIIEAGIDVARYGDDETVFCIRQGYRVVALEPYRGWAITKTAGYAVNLSHSYKPMVIRVDDTGVGGGVTDILKEAKLWQFTSVLDCNFGGEGDENYANATGVLWGHIRKMLQDGHLELPDDDDLVGELTTRKYSINSKGKIALERKEDLKKRGLPSPGRADALSLAFSGDGHHFTVDTSDRKREYQPRTNNRNGYYD
jgi:phage terminase large subunit